MFADQEYKKKIQNRSRRSRSTTRLIINYNCLYVISRVHIKLFKVVNINRYYGQAFDSLIVKKFIRVRLDASFKHPPEITFQVTLYMVEIKMKVGGRWREYAAANLSLCCD